MTRTRLPAFLVTFAAVVTCVGIASTSAASTGFSFAVPEGWTDISAGAPEASLKGLPAESFVDAQSGKYAALAVDVAHAGDGFGENLKALVRPGSQAIDEQTVAEAAAAMGRVPDTEVREQGLAEIGGVPVGRIISDKTVGGRKTRTLSYLLPGKDEHAILTYEATPDTFESYLPVFERAAAQTQGLVRMTAPRRTPRLIAVGVFVGVVGLAAAWAALRRGRRARGPGR
jgi:hypothetical protein